MRSAIFILFVTILVPAFAPAQNAGGSKYIGYKYDSIRPGTTLPNGVTHMGGGLLGDIQADPVYGISQVETGKTKMLWLEASTRKDSTGVLGWEVLDVLSFRALGPANYIFFTGDPAISCSRNGREIPNLVGIGRIVRREGIFKPSNLWTADLTTKKFEPAETSNVKCNYSEP
ncbi:MAG TPA: hypothetical protein VFZ23_16435 [Pyrinomonadaceae bacterium]